MTTTKKILFVLVLIFLVNIFPVRILAEEKHYVPVSPDQPFATNSIIVMMKIEVSMQIKNYTVDDFAEVSPDELIDINPYDYQIYVQYLKHEIDELPEKLNIRRTFTLKWDRNFTKEEIIEKIHILEKRDDIYCVQPNYLYQPDGGSIMSEVDFVSDDIWQNYHYIKVVDKDNSTYRGLDDGLTRKVIKAELIKSYDKLVDCETSYDKFLEESLENNVFEFVVNDELYDKLQVGYEYIIRLHQKDQVKIKKVGSQLELLKYDTSSQEFVNVVNNRMYFPNTIKLGKTDIYHFSNTTIFTTKFNQYIFKKEFTKNDLPFEFELKLQRDFAGDLINAVIPKEEQSKVDPNIYYTYYYVKTANFMFSGDNVLMFDEYIRLAKIVCDTGELYSYNECASLRNSALSRING